MEQRASCNTPSAIHLGRALAPGPEQLQAPLTDGPATFYLHDKDAILPDVPGREEKLPWSVVKWTPNHYTVRVVAPSDGYLLNLGNDNSYWKAYVDGKWQRILRANFTMQAILLTKGEHVVEWRYDPLPFKLGWLAFYLVLVAMLAMFAFSGLRSPRCAGAARS